MLFLVVLLFSAATAEPCTSTNCLLSQGCACESSVSPIATDATPQFIILTSDDAVTDYIYTNYWVPLLRSRTNPDGNPISGTIFVPHEYTDYERVNDLYNAGFEIGVNSITKNLLNSYWAEATHETLYQEFAGSRETVSHFANIPISSVKGARTPYLEVNGDTTYGAYVASELAFDNSLAASSTRRLFPYTLDYDRDQTCVVGKCPTGQYPGFWVVPINDLRNQNGSDCVAVQGCQVDGTEDEIFRWFKSEFERAYNGNRAPVSFLVNAAWFQIATNSFAATEKFLDYLAEFKDVYLVSIEQAIEWRKNPVSSTVYKTTVSQRNAPCSARTCVLDFSETEIRYMKSCVACPAVYPWLGNPLGQANQN